MSDPGVKFRAEVLTLFPAMIRGYVGESILGKAIEKGLIEIRATDIRAYAEGKHKVCDDAPYGGGAGMVMKPEPIVAALEDAKTRLPQARVLLMTPRGQPLTQDRVRALAAHDGLILLCGRYEGVDERVMPHIDEEVSLGDFVLTGGELAALAVIDAVARRFPGVLGNEASAGSESFEEGLLEYPQYTRPPVFRGATVPAVLQSGDHARIARWRRYQALKLTQARRPDLFARLTLSPQDQKLLAKREEDL